MGTHINAFYADVGAAKAKVALAQGELEAAESALKAHPDFVEPASEEVAEPEQSEPKTVKKPKK